MEKICGIYKITNPNGKVYIGKSTNVEKRKNCYKNLNIHKQPKIFNSIKKYGWECHNHEVLEICAQELLNEREIFWKKHYLNKCGGDWGQVLFCNLHDMGGGPLSPETKNKIGKIHKGVKRSDETKRKISEAKTGFRCNEETKKLKSQIAKGKPKSPETREKMSKSRKGYKCSEEHKNNCKQAYQNRSYESKLKTINAIKNIPQLKRIEMSKSRWRPVSQFSLELEWIADFNNIQEASKQTLVRHDSISQCCNKKNKTAGGYIWMFK